MFIIDRNKVLELALQTSVNESPPTKGDEHDGSGTDMFINDISDTFYKTA